MRTLTDQERIALREVGPPDEGPVSQETFDECVRQGWGYWSAPPDDHWHVTDAGRRALALDDAARAAR